MKYDCIIAIDPGKNGGIAVIDKNGLRTFKMPQSIRLMVDLLEEEAKTHTKILGLVENVGIRPGDIRPGKIDKYTGEPTTTGKVFNIAKMLENAKECRNAMEIARIEFKLPYPRQWQAYLRLQGPKDEDKTVRKNRYKSFAQGVFPNVKITLATSDAVCLAVYGFQVAKKDQEILDNMVGNS